MKSKTFFITLLFITTCYAGLVRAQQPALLADQNPRYMESQAKYSAMIDTLTATQGTTVQKTYKAFDWYQNKLERRRQNREWRHQEVMSGAYSYPSWSLYGGYSYPYSNYGYGYGSQWGSNGFWGPRAGIGFGYNW